MINLFTFIQIERKKFLLNFNRVKLNILNNGNFIFHFNEHYLNKKVFLPV